MTRQTTWRWTSDRYFVCASGHWVTILLHGDLPEQHTSRSAVAWIKTLPGMRECRSHTLPAWLMLAWPTVWPAEHRSKINSSPLSAGLQPCRNVQPVWSGCIQIDAQIHRTHTALAVNSRGGLSFCTLLALNEQVWAESGPYVPNRTG